MRVVAEISRLARSTWPGARDHAGGRRRRCGDPRGQERDGDERLDAVEDLRHHLRPGGRDRARARLHQPAHPRGAGPLQGRLRGAGPGPPGAAKTLALDAHVKKIDEYLALKLNKRAMAKLLNVSPNTLYEWLRRRRQKVIVNSSINSQQQV